MSTDCTPPVTPRSGIDRRGALRGFLHLFWMQPVWAVPFALFFGTLYGAPYLANYVHAFKVSLVFSGCIGLALWAMRWFGQPALMAIAGRRGSAAGWEIGLWYGGAALISSMVAMVIVNATLLPGFVGTPRALLINVLFSLLFIALFVGINYALAFYRQAAERARAVEQIRAELAQAELRALRAQINPHFLFNTLNTIASLVRQDPAAAEDTVTRLAELFRYALRGSIDGHATLADELMFLRHYLAIEHTRFGERLTVTEHVEPGLEDARVPSLLLQPLVENAVRYAVAQRAQGGRVRLTARRDGGRLLLEIADDGPGFDPARRPDGNGFGLHSVRERLRAAGPPHALEIDSRPGRGTTVRVVIPLVFTGDAPAGRGPDEEVTS
jgi:signal transduction histidine kinase